MDKTLIQKIGYANKAIEEAYQHTDDIQMTYNVYLGYEKRLKNAKTKFMYVGLMAFFILSGLFSNWVVIMRVNRMYLWIGLLVFAAVIYVSCKSSYKREIARAAVQVEERKEELDEEVLPIRTKLDQNVNVRTIPEAYRFPSAVSYILEALESNEANSINEAGKRFNEYLEDSRTDEPNVYRQIMREKDLHALLYPSDKTA